MSKKANSSKTVKSTKKGSGKKSSPKKPVKKLSPLEASFDTLIRAWLSTTMNNKNVDFNEIFNRLNTIFRVSCESLDVSIEEAEKIAWTFSDSYARMVLGDDYVCPDCKAEMSAEHDENHQSGVKTEKLLN